METSVTWLASWSWDAAASFTLRETNTDQVLDIRCLNVPEIVCICRARTVVYQIVKPDVCEPCNESFIYTWFDSGYLWRTVSDSEWAVNLNETLNAWLETKEHTHCFLINHNKRESESVSQSNVRLDCPISAFLVKSQTTDSLQYTL